jgi:hypothetical protein
MKKAIKQLDEKEWDFKFSTKQKEEESCTALCWEWEFSREINREKGMALRGTNAWCEEFNHKKNVPFFEAVPRQDWGRIWEKIKSAWLEVGAIEEHEARIFPWFSNHTFSRRMERESAQTFHRKSAKGEILETAHCFPIRWEVPDKFILREMRSWLEHYRKSGFPAGKVAKARRQKPWVGIHQTHLRELGVYRAWKHHGRKVRDFKEYIPKYEESANYSKAVSRSKQMLSNILRWLEEQEPQGCCFMF